MMVMQSNLPWGILFPKGTLCVPFRTEALEIKPEPQNVISGNSGCDPFNQICPRSFCSCEECSTSIFAILQACQMNIYPWNVINIIYINSRCVISEWKLSTIPIALISVVLSQ